MAARISLVPQLTSDTLARAGMAVRVRSNVLWPKAWQPPSDGGCQAVGSMCTMSGASCSTTVVDVDFPCDTRSTPTTRERCIQPTALIQAPVEIDSCPGTSLTLDGTLSTGGGIRPLTYTWTANPRLSDSYYKLAPALAARGGVGRGVVTLGPAELDDGRRFEIWLVVTNFLGIVSTPQSIVVQRAALPVPSISIKAPPVLYLPRASSVVIQAAASIANCFAGNGTGGRTSAIGFTWSHEASSGNATVKSGAIVLDAISSSLRDLVVRGVTLLTGVRCASTRESPTRQSPLRHPQRAF